MVHTEILPPFLIESRKAGRFSTRRRRVNRLHLTGTAELKEWLKEFTKDHWYFCQGDSPDQLKIAFHGKQDAVLFKLTWGGNRSFVSKRDTSF